MQQTSAYHSQPLLLWITPPVSILFKEVNFHFEYIVNIHNLMIVKGESFMWKANYCDG